MGEYFLKLYLLNIDEWIQHVCLFMCICLYATTQADSSELLRQYGLSLLYSHIVLLTRTRACQLEAPPKPPPVPRWKLIRLQKKIAVTDEPQSAWEM